METPSSTRRLTRSQTLASANNNKKFEDSEKGLTKSRQQDRSALIDITNDSPIVGLAKGNFETPSSSAMSKKRGAHISSRVTKPENTPGSGEALLRGQVKTLLQKVEEEAELSKLSIEHGHGGPFLSLKGLVNSPMGLLLAPTPANTPQILSLSAQRIEWTSLGLPSPVEDKFEISQMVSGIIEAKGEDVSDLDKSMMVTRSLLMDFSEKSEVAYSSECSSEVTFQGTEESESVKDDDASIWSIQVNASTKDEEDYDDDEVEEEFDDSEDYYEEEEEEEADSELVDELCDAVSKISVNGGAKTMTEFTGKHTRFCYNSDGEIEGEEEVGSSSSSGNGGALRLKGLPTPRGKHIRFPEEIHFVQICLCQGCWGVCLSCDNYFCC